MSHLRTRVVQHVYSPEGRQADVAIIEPNGEEHVVRCLCRTSGGTDLGDVGSFEVLTYLDGRYGSDELCRAARAAVLGD